MLPAWQIQSNFYFYFQNKLVKIISSKEDKAVVQFKTSEQLEVPIKELKPVPITEKWLTHLGFVFKEKYWIKDLFAFRYYDGTLFKLYPNSMQVHFTMRIDVKDVHHLQIAIAPQKYN